MTDIVGLRQLHDTMAYRNLRDPLLASDIIALPGQYLLSLYPTRFDARVLWQEIKATVISIAAGIGPGSPDYRQHVESAYAVAAPDALSSREYLITKHIKQHLPKDVNAVFETVENDYTAFVTDTGAQYFWTHFDEIASMLLTGTYLLVGYAYLPQTFWDDEVAQDAALAGGIEAVLLFMGEVLL